MNAVAINAAATVFSDIIDVGDARGVAVLTTVDQAHVRAVQASHDGVVWASIVGGGSLPSAMTNTSASPGAFCQMLNPCGMRFLRLSITNNGGSTATASAWATLS
jgi:hypothetical protein